MKIRSGAVKLHVWQGRKKTKSRKNIEFRGGIIEFYNIGVQKFFNGRNIIIDSYFLGWKEVKDFDGNCTERVFFKVFLKFNLRVCTSCYWIVYVFVYYFLQEVTVAFWIRIIHLESVEKESCQAEKMSIHKR